MNVVSISRREMQKRCRAAGQQIGHVDERKHRVDGQVKDALWPVDRKRHTHVAVPVIENGEFEILKPQIELSARTPADGARDSSPLRNRNRIGR